MGEAGCPEGQSGVEYLHARVCSGKLTFVAPMELSRPPGMSPAGWHRVGGADRPGKGWKRPLFPHSTHRVASPPHAQGSSVRATGR